MTEIVWMTLPIRFHLREKIGPVDALGLGDSILHYVRPLTVNLVVVCSEEVIKPRSNALERFILCGVSLT